MIKWLRISNTLPKNATDNEQKGDILWSWVRETQMIRTNLSFQVNILFLLWKQQSLCAGDTGLDCIGFNF